MEKLKKCLRQDTEIKQIFNHTDVIRDLPKINEEIKRHYRSEDKRKSTESKIVEDGITKQHNSTV